MEVSVRIRFRIEVSYIGRVSVRVSLRIRLKYKVRVIERVKYNIGRVKVRCKSEYWVRVEVRYSIRF